MRTAIPTSEIERLPTLPVVVVRLMEVFASEDFGMKEVVAELETDPSVSGRLLRLANSAYYGVPREVDTLHRAVVLLGGVIVQGLALGISVFRRWSRSTTPLMAKEIWVHSYLCATGCRYLSCRLPAQFRLLSADSLFLAGLFHDIGKILFLSHGPDLYGQLLEQISGEELRREEREGFGRDHAEMGGELLASWGFPPEIVAVVQFHHRPDLRAELRPAWRVIRAVHRLLDGVEKEADIEEKELPPGLLEDLAEHLEKARPKARAFYEAVV